MESGPDSLFVTLLLLLHSSHSESERFEVLGPTDLIVAVAGDDIILPCYLKPNISAEDMTVDWLNLDFIDSRVYRYQNSEIIQEDQISSYRERTSLFKEELRRGNTSLKLTRVQGTDEGRYKCLIKAKSWYDDFTIQVLVKAVGSKPLVSIEGHREGGMGLLCESEGWHPEPELVWLDSKGVHLSAGPPETLRNLKGFYTVKQHVIVQETDTNRFTCRVQQSRINEKMETEVHLPSELFHHTSPWRMAFIVLCCLGAITVIGLALAIYWINNKKGVIIDQLKLQRDDLKKEKDEVKKNLTSKLGQLLNQNDEVKKNLTSKLGQLLNQNGQLLNQNGQLLNQNDQLLNQNGQLLNQNVLLTEQRGQLLNQNGQQLNQNRQLLNQNGNLLNQNTVHAGTVQDLTCLLVDLYDQRVLLTEQQGNLLNQNGQLLNQNVLLTEQQGNLLNQNSNNLNQIGNNLIRIGGLLNQNSQQLNQNVDVTQDQGYSSPI